MSPRISSSLIKLIKLINLRADYAVLEGDRDRGI